MNQDFGYGVTEGKPRRNPGPIIAVIITALSLIFVAYVRLVLPGGDSTQATQTAESRPSEVTVTEAPAAEPTFAWFEPTGKLTGILTDREGNPISDLSVSIRNGPSTRTDIEGRFVLSEVEQGDQLIVVKPPSGDGQFTLNVSVVAEQTNNITIVYDTATSRLGLLSIVAPVENGDLEIRKNVDDNGVTVHRATVFGRCDGLGQIFDNEFDVWVLVSSELDGRFWVQFPAATVDPNDSTWSANIVLGDAQHPPSDGESWTIVAVATSVDSGMDMILNTPKLSLLPPHITSNVVHAKSRID